MLNEGYSYENWRDKFGAMITVGLAACQLGKDKGSLDKVEKILNQVSEPQKRNLPDFYKNLYNSVENELLSLQAAQKPSDQELELIAKIEKTPSDLESRFALA